MTETMKRVTRDVMNSKSDVICRHAVPYDDYTTLSKYYAVESRRYLSQWTEPTPGCGWKTWVHVSPLCWFSNELIFDFDAHDEDFKNDEEAEKWLDERLKGLYALLGQPSALIKNKNDYTQAQIDRYFTKNGVVGLPKKYGCQVIYSLKESLKGQYVELVKLFNEARLIITKKVGADEQFRGHMHKNMHNVELFETVKNEESHLIDFKCLFDTAGIDKTRYERVMSLKPFETLEKKLSPAFMRLNTSLVRWYCGLNQWRRRGSGVDKPKIDLSLISLTSLRTESRNVSLFNWMSHVPTDVLVNIDLSDVPKSLFDLCTINESLGADEFESVRNSVLTYREATGTEPSELATEEDNRVLKVDLLPIDFNWFENVKNQFQSEAKIATMHIHAAKFSEASQDWNIEVPLYDGGSPSKALANWLLLADGMQSLRHIRSLITPDSIHSIEGELDRLGLLTGHGLYDVYQVVCDAVYLVHFATYHALKDWRHRKSNVVETRQSSKSESKVNGTQRSLYHLKTARRYTTEGELISQALKFKSAYRLLSRNGHLKDDGTPKPISYYQELFHCRTADASIYVKVIRMYLILLSVFGVNQDSTKVSSKSIVPLIQTLIITSTYTVKSVIVPLKSITWYCFYHANDNNCSKLQSYLFHLKENDDIYHKKGEISMNYLIFDVETTGFKPQKDPILSIGAILWNDKFDTTEEFYRLLDWTRVPGVNLVIPESSISVHGITLETLRTDQHAYHPVSVFLQMSRWVKETVPEEDRGLHVINAFNSQFDVNMVRADLQWVLNRYVREEGPGGGYGDIDDISLTSEDIAALEMLYSAFTKREVDGVPNGGVLFIDSMTLDRILHFEEDGIKLTHNLEDVGLRYGLDPNEHAHNAMYDTRRLADVLKKQIEELHEMGLTVDQKLEDRIFRKYHRDAVRWGKSEKEGEDYYGRNVPCLVI